MGIMGGERVRPDGYGGHSAGRLEHAPILSTGSAKSMKDQRVDDASHGVENGMPIRIGRFADLGQPRDESEYSGTIHHLIVSERGNV